MDLVKKAEDFIAKFDLDTACKFYERALQMEERNDGRQAPYTYAKRRRPWTRSRAAVVQLERGDIDTAEKLLRASIDCCTK